MMVRASRSAVSEWRKLRARGLTVFFGSSTAAELADQGNMKFATAQGLMLVVGLGCARSDTRSDTPKTAGVTANAVTVDRDSTASLRPVRMDYLISKSGIGGLRLEMTLDEARRALPTARFTRTSDGDGAALVEVTLAADTSMILWAEEEDAETDVDWSKRIKTIETFSPAFHTTEGVHPGSLVTDVEAVFGKTREISKSEIESREYIVFEAQPTQLTFRLNYSGIFQNGRRTTKEFQPRATILSIAVSSR